MLKMHFVPKTMYRVEQTNLLYPLTENENQVPYLSEYVKDSKIPSSTDLLDDKIFSSVPARGQGPIPKENSIPIFMKFWEENFCI